LWAALLMSLAGPQIQYAQEARNYALLTLVALAAAAALVRMERRGAAARWAPFALGAAVLATSLTHYFALGTVLTLGLYAMLRLRGRPRRRAMLAFAAAAVIWLVTWAPIGLQQFEHVADPRILDFLRDSAPGYAGRFVRRLALLPARYFAEPPDDSLAVAAAGGLVFVVAALFPVRRRDMLLWALWLPLTVLPVALLDAARHTKHLEFIRYTLLASPAAYAVIGAALDRTRSRWWLSHVSPALAAIGCAAALPGAYSAWWKADWRSLARAAESDVRPGDVTVFVSGGETWPYPHAAFLHTSFYRQRPPGPIVLLYGAANESLLAQLKDAPGVIIIAQGGVDDALPGARLEWLAHEPGAGRCWRGTWKDEPPATATATSGTSEAPR